jgi:hypothetical protein
MPSLAALSRLRAASEPAAPACRGCGAPDGEAFCDLGLLPETLAPVRADAPGPVACRPLRLFLCRACGLVQPAEPGAEPGFGAAVARALRGRGIAPRRIRGGDALARAADPHDVAAGLRILLAPGGSARLDLPWILPALRDLRPDLLRGGCLFDLASAEALLAEHRLAVFDAAAGPRLRLRLCHAEDARPVAASVAALRAREAVDRPSRDGFAARFAEARCALLDLLIGLRRAGRVIAAAGEAAPADALLTACGAGPDLVAAIAVPGVTEPGLCLPGSRIPLLAPDGVAALAPDFVLLLPQPCLPAAIALAHDWGARPVLPLPRLQIL